MADPRRKAKSPRVAAARPDRATRWARHWDDLVPVFCLLLSPFFVYVAIADVVFSFRNPTANATALWRQPYEVLTLQKLPEYQPK